MPCLSSNNHSFSLISPSFPLTQHLKTGMKSYFNGGGSTSSATPPPSMSGRNRSSAGHLMMGARSSSASLPRSPENDLVPGGSGSGGLVHSSGSGQGSLGSHSSNQEVYVNIYQNTNHPSLFVSATNDPSKKEPATNKLH